MSIFQGSQHLNFLLCLVKRFWVVSIHVTMLWGTYPDIKRWTFIQTLVHFTSWTTERYQQNTHGHLGTNQGNKKPGIQSWNNKMKVLEVQKSSNFQLQTKKLPTFLLTPDVFSFVCSTVLAFFWLSQGTSNSKFSSSMASESVWGAPGTGCSQVGHEKFPILVRHNPFECTVQKRTKKCNLKKWHLSVSQ